jgi:hypothetical protein
LTNSGDTDRRARVFVAHKNQLDLRYGRDVWVPAHSTLKTWMLVGPPGLQEPVPQHELNFWLFDRTTGEDVEDLRQSEGGARKTMMTYRPRETATAVLLDGEVQPLPVFGELPRPESRDDETLHLVHTFRYASRLSEQVLRINPGPMPATAEEYEGIQHVILASRRIADDPAGAQALRRWVQGGGRLWVMLDRIEPEALASLLGEALDFQVVDRVGLTEFEIESQTSDLRRTEAEAQKREQPVDFVRVLLPPGERARHTVDGWPAWFTRRVGRGKVVFTTLGARGLIRPRLRSDPRSPYREGSSRNNAIAFSTLLLQQQPLVAATCATYFLLDLDYPDLPMPLAPLDAVAKEMEPARETFPARAFEPLLVEEIGYSIVSRVTVGLVLAGFLLATLTLGLLLRRSRRPELVGLLAPGAALGVAGVLLLLGESSRRAVPPTVATAQVVDAVSGTPEVELHGLVAVYHPDEGPAEASAEQGGFFELDMAGVEGKVRRRVQTDMDAWHWEGLNLPAGVRLAPFRRSVPTREPMAAVARLGPDGIEGQWTAAPFKDLADAVLSTPNSRALAVRRRPDGGFRAGPGDVLPVGQYLAGAVLSDEQQRRQKLYREFLKPVKNERPDNRPVLMAWARPIETHFRLASEARETGTALLIVPLRLEPSVPGTQVTIPGPLIPFQRVQPGGPTLKPVLGSRQKVDMELRFQLPAAVLPLEVERARLSLSITAPSRHVTLAGHADGQTIPLHQEDSPLGPLRVEITEKRYLQLDAEGGLHLDLNVSELLQDRARGKQDEEWSIEYLDLEIRGRVGTR